MGMRATPGVAQKMFPHAGREGHQHPGDLGPPEIKISVLIAEDYTELALRRATYGLRLDAA